MNALKTSSVTEDILLAAQVIKIMSCIINSISRYCKATEIYLIIKITRIVVVVLIMMIIVIIEINNNNNGSNIVNRSYINRFFMEYYQSEIPKPMSIC